MFARNFRLYLNLEVKSFNLYALYEMKSASAHLLIIFLCLKVVLYFYLLELSFCHIKFNTCNNLQIGSLFKD